MKYAEYRKSFQRTVKFVKISIVSVSVLAVIGVATMIITSTDNAKIGNIEEISDIDVKYEYGEKIVITGSAYKSNVIFEYSKLEEDNWGEKQPTFVGKYKVRGRSNGHGGPKYTDIYTFEIEPIPAEISVIQNSVNYGSSVNLTAAGLINGDFLKDDYVVSFASLKDTKSMTVMNHDSIKIFNGDGEDVTPCYILTYVEKEVSFVPRVINVKFTNKSKVYDGTPLKDDDYEITSGSLLEGDSLVVTGGSEISAIGSITNNHVVKVYDKDGDINPNYTVNVTDNTLVVNKINISSSSKSKTKTYDGYPFSDDVFEVTYEENKLLAGHRFVYDNSSIDRNQYKVSSIQNEYTCTIKDEDDNDVSEFYNISKSFGTLTINKKSISIESKSSAISYDGVKLSNKEFTHSELASTDNIELLTWTEIGPNVTSSTSNVHTYKINHVNPNDETDIEDVTDQYLINYTRGNLMIESIPITIAFPGNNYVYDGAYHKIYNLEEKVVTGLDTSKYHLDVSLKDTNSNLKKDYSSNGYKLTANDLNVAIYNNHDENVTSNFNISYTFNTTQIAKKDASITTGNYEMTYNGYTLDNYDSSIGYTTTGLVGDDYAERSLTNQTSIYQAGTGNIIYTWTIKDSYNNNVTNNYNLTIKDGTYKINKAEITLTPTSNSREYNGEDTVNSNVFGFSVNGDLANTDTISLNSRVIKLDNGNVGTHNVTFSADDFNIKHGGEDAKNNYIVNVVNSATLNIYQRPAYVTQIKNNSFFDGVSHGVNNREDFSVTNLVSDHTYNFEGATMFYNEGSYSYQLSGEETFNDYFDLRIYDADSKDVTNNYDIHYNYYDSPNYYQYNIIKKQITVTSYDQYQVYSGSAFDPNLTYNNTYGYSVTGDGLNKVDNVADKVIVTKPTNRTRPVHVADNNDTSKNQFTFDVKVEDKNGNDVTDNYSIVKNYGFLYIEQAVVYVNCTNASTLYGDTAKLASMSAGTAFKVTTTTESAYGVYISSSNLPNNSPLTVEATTTAQYDKQSVYHAGTYVLNAEVQIYQTISGVKTIPDENDAVVHLQRSTVSFEVNRRPLTIETVSYTGKYNPKRPVAAPEQRTVTGLASDDTIYFGNEAYSKDKRYYESVEDKITSGTYVNEVGSYEIRHGNVIVTSDYNINIIEGTITIKS